MVLTTRPIKPAALGIISLKTPGAAAIALEREVPDRLWLTRVLHNVVLCLILSQYDNTGRPVQTLTMEGSGQALAGEKPR